jgi:hypothetical protein
VEPGTSAPFPKFVIRRASALLAAAGLLQAGVPIGTCILLSLLGALASFYLLRTYFAALKATG